MAAPGKRVRGRGSSRLPTGSEEVTADVSLEAGPLPEEDYLRFGSHVSVHEFMKNVEIVKGTFVRGTPFKAQRSPRQVFYRATGVPFLADTAVQAKLPDQMTMHELVELFRAFKEQYGPSPAEDVFQIELDEPRLQAIARLISVLDAVVAQRIAANEMLAEKAMDEALLQLTLAADLLRRVSSSLDRQEAVLEINMRWARQFSERVLGIEGQEALA